MSKKIHILVVDDETAMRECLRDWLLEDGYEVGLAASGPEAIAMARDYPWHVVLLDLKMPGMDGLQALAELRQVAPNAEVVMMTAYATVDTAVQAMKSGAFDYLVKPFDPEEVELLIKKVVSHQELVLENILLRRRLEEREEFDEIIGQSQPMLDLFETLSRVAPADSTVLITGESGTGKELVARAIHGNSPRCYHPFITVSCGALPDSLLESELFGHEKGAFTGADQSRKGRIEMANGGTLFLDEIGELRAREHGRAEREAGELGLSAIDIPERFGGLGLDKTTSALTAEALTCRLALARDGLGHRAPLIQQPPPQRVVADRQERFPRCRVVPRPVDRLAHQVQYPTQSLVPDGHGDRFSRIFYRSAANDAVRAVQSNQLVVFKNDEGVGVELSNRTSAVVGKRPYPFHTG